MASLYGVLEKPQVHDFCQKVMSLGRQKALRLTEKFLFDNCRGRILDLGCGTARYAHLFKDAYVGLDINADYLKQKPEHGKIFVCADSRQAPFKDGCFDTIFSVGVFHHIDPRTAKAIYAEMARMAKPCAKILIVDFFYPDVTLDIPGWLVSKLDRGKFVRRREIFMRELAEYFEVVGSRYIDHSYPYNLYAFIVQGRSARGVSCPSKD